MLRARRLAVLRGTVLRASRLPPLPATSHERAGRRTGKRAERRAAWHYRLRGYRILDANVWAGGNELDLVARRGRHLVFVEVKSKSGEGHGDPLEMVTPEKQRGLLRAARAYLSARPELAGLDCAFDVVAVRGAALERVPGAFEPGW